MVIKTQKKGDTLETVEWANENYIAVGSGGQIMPNNPPVFFDDNNTQFIDGGGNPLASNSVVLLHDSQFSLSNTETLIRTDGFVFKKVL